MQTISVVVWLVWLCESLNLFSAPFSLRAQFTLTEIEAGMSFHIQSTKAYIYMHMCVHIHTYIHLYVYFYLDPVKGAVQ